MKKIILLLVVALCVSAAFGQTVVKRSVGGSSAIKNSKTFPMEKRSAGGRMGNLPGMVFPDSDTAKQLKLTPSQKRLLDSINNSYRTKLMSLRDSGSPDDFRKLAGDYDTAFKRILTGSQKKQYESTDRRYTGFPDRMSTDGNAVRPGDFPSRTGGIWNGFERNFMENSKLPDGGFFGMISPDDVAVRKLSLSSAQKKALNSLNKNYSTKVRNLRNTPGFAHSRKGGPLAASDTFAKIRELRNEYESAFMDILSSSQRNAFDMNRRSGDMGNFPQRMKKDGSEGTAQKGFPKRMAPGR